MRMLRAAAAAATALVLVGTAAAGVSAQPEPEVGTGPEFAWVTYVTESNPRSAPGPVPSGGDGPGYTYMRNASYAWDLESSDPRLNGTLTGTFSDDCFGDPDLTCVGWNTEEIVGPDGSWTGWVWMTHRPDDPEDPMAHPMMTLAKVFRGHGGYEDLTLMLFGEGPLGGKADFHGLIYEGAPPPPFNELAFPEPGAE